VTDSLGHSSFTAYDKAGRKRLETDANGNATAFHYDDAGRLLRVTEASGAETAYTYDRNGNKLTQKDANGNTWSFTYDALNRLVQEKDPLNRTSSMSYDAIGNLKTKTDGKGQTTTYAYTVRRLATVTYADGAAESFTYDPLGRRTGMSNASVSMAYAYDNLNRINKVTNQTYNHVVNYGYDPAGNISSRSIVADGLGRVFGNRTLTTQYAYDGKNRLTTISDPLAGTFRFAYDPMDRRTSLAYPNGTSTFYNYDKGYRLTALATKGSSGAVIDAWSYQYDAVGNRVSKTDMDGKVEGYTYDNTYRLTEARYGDGTRETFTYDPVGNRKTRTDESGTTITYSYDIANQLLTSGTDTFTYDANGNMTAKTTSAGTTTMSYDSANRVSAIGGVAGKELNTWAPDGRRMQIIGDTFIFESGQSGGTGQPIRPIYDLAGNPIADGDNQGQTILRYRVYGPGVDEPLAEVIPGANIAYLHHDALGSITCATDQF
jgi:YD repeat-containing protein